MPDVVWMLLVCTLPSSAMTITECQPASAVQSPGPSAAAIQPVPQIPQIRPPAARRSTARFRPFAVASTIFDSNINHDRDEIDAYGVLVGGGAIFRNNPQRPTLELQYQAGLHRYTGTTAWDRLSHYARAAWNRRVRKRFALEAVSEVSIKGSTEDRELSNQLALSPRLEFRVTPALRLRGFGAWRVKRYEDTPDRNAFNRYAGLELVGRPRSGVRWEVGGRYELNAAESDRQRYLRRTWYGGLTSPITRHDQILLDIHYRQRKYPHRFVDVAHGPDVLRRDTQVEPGVSWLHTINDTVEIRIGYGFNGRDSNDPRRDYRSHEVLLSTLRRW